MITWGDLYTVLSALVPLYVAMFLAYGSVRWWKIFTPVQCSGINRFVAVFAVPLLSFHFISTNDPYKMDGLFILADTLSKLAVLLLLAIWARFSRYGSLDWMITIFAVATLPNTLVMGIPMLTAMYGTFYGGLMVQLVVLQCIVWYTLMLFLFEYRGAAALLRQQFPETAASIVSVKVDSDVVSLDGRDPVQTFADVGEDGKIRVTIRRSISSCSQAFNNYPFNNHSPRVSVGIDHSSSKAMTPRPSNLTGAEIYSVYSSRNNTPREYYYGGATGAGWAAYDGFNHFHPNHQPAPAPITGPQNYRPSSPTRPSNFTVSDVYSVQSSRGPTPRASNANNEDRGCGAAATVNANGSISVNSPRLPTTASGPFRHPSIASFDAAASGKLSGLQIKQQPGNKNVNNHAGGDDGAVDGCNIIHINGSTAEYQKLSEAANGDVHEGQQVQPYLAGGDDFSFGSKGRFPAAETAAAAEKQRHSISRSSTGAHSPTCKNAAMATLPVAAAELPAAPVLAKLILRMVGRKLLQNPNTYSSLIGLIWSLIAFRWNIAMPKIISNSISLVSDAGLGMAMFSLGLFMALQPRLIACGTAMAVFAMAIRFLTGPAVMAAASIAVGLRGVDLHAAIVQAALPQGIVPFVFAREYDLHPDILSTAVIFGMLVALPTTILYYVLLGL